VQHLVALQSSNGLRVETEVFRNKFGLWWPKPSGWGRVDRRNLSFSGVRLSHQLW